MGGNGSHGGAGNGVGGDVGGADNSGSCSNGATETKSCGFNGQGTAQRVCNHGSWADFGACQDPQECENGHQQTQGCGLNGTAVEKRTCVDGHWLDWSACSAIDVCLNGSLSSSACGLNGKGTKQQPCVGGIWSAFGVCTDPDVCGNGAEELHSCGLNGNGSSKHTCVNGTWNAWQDCVDPDECSNSDAQWKVCGLNGNATQQRHCANGAWSTWSSCYDTDVCVNGSKYTEDCGNGGVHNGLCSYGTWSISKCALPPGPCAGDVNIVDQATMDLYSTCTSIEGNLALVPVMNVGRPLTMGALVQVGGSVTVQSDSLLGISLPVLTSLGGSFTVEGSNQLGGVSVPKLSIIPGDLEYKLHYTNSLNSKSSLDFAALGSVGGHLRLYGSPELTSLALPALQQVGGDLWIGDYAQARGTGLADLNGLSSLTTVGGSLVIAGNVALSDLSGLSGLNSLGHDLLIRYNPMVADLSCFAALHEIPGSLALGHFFGQPSVSGFSYGVEVKQTSLHGLHHLQRVGGNLQLGDVSVSGLSELAALSEIGGSLQLEKMGTNLVILHSPPVLEHLGGLSISNSIELQTIDFAIQQINHDIQLSDGFRLTTVRFPTLTTLGGVLSLERMESFPAKPGSNVLSFPELTHAGSLQLQSKCGPSKLSAFPKLVTIEQSLDLNIYNGDASSQAFEIADFNQLQTIGGNLTIACAHMTQLVGFGQLSAVGGEVSLTGATKGISAFYYDHDLQPPPASTFASLTSCQKLTIGGFTSLQPCWAQNLAAQIWPNGSAQADLWGLPVCKP